MASLADSEATRRQYASDEMLRLRQQIHERYTVPPIDFPAWVLNRLQWHGDETVLDVGTGAGFYVAHLRQHAPRVRFVGLDYSAGMLENHPAFPALVQGDVQDLPFGGAAFDVVMANHMLYHVPDVDSALVEMKRVLKPGGVLIAATNSASTMPEYTALFRRAVMLLANPGAASMTPLSPLFSSFTLESGTRRLARHFFAVVRFDLPQLLVFTTPEPALSYFASWRQFREPLLPEEVHWDDVMMLMREQIERVLDAAGELVVNKISGVLIATDGGGFIAPYVARR